MAILGPQTREEEEGRAPDRFRTMIDEQGFTALLGELDTCMVIAQARRAAAAG